MSRSSKLSIIYVSTLVLGSAAAASIVSHDADYLTMFGFAILTAALYSLPALVISLIAHVYLHHLDNMSYFRMMMRVLLGVLVATYLVLLATGFVQPERSDMQRAYLVFSAVAVSATFLLLKPEKK